MKITMRQHCHWEHVRLHRPKVPTEENDGDYDDKNVPHENICCPKVPVEENGGDKNDNNTIIKGNIPVDEDNGDNSNINIVFMYFKARYLSNILR